MKALKIAIISILALHLAFSFFNWVSETPSPTIQDPTSVAASEGLELPALLGVVKKTHSAQELERKLNEKDGVNNLDLNADEKVDYIHVTEFGDPAKKIGYSLTIQPAKSQTQEIATVRIEKNNDRAEIQVEGNEQIYGTDAIYNDSVAIESENRETASGGTNGTMAQRSYFYPHSLWVSPFYYGFYPSYYSFFPIVHRPIYINRISSYRSPSVRRGGNTFQRQSDTRIANPNKGKVANRGITRSLRQPTSTQRQFQTQRAGRNRSGGFGRDSMNRGTSQKSRVGNTTRSSSTSRFGGSFRSRSFTTRSFGGFGK